MEITITICTRKLATMETAKRQAFILSRQSLGFLTRMEEGDGEPRPCGKEFDTKQEVGKSMQEMGEILSRFLT